MTKDLINNSEANIQKQFEQHLTCVIIPTYNNATTLTGVITDVLKYTNNVIVVNDGSTDDTERIVKKIELVQLISYQPNTGKGSALRKAFTYARQKGYEYAITIDSDGQHFAKDLPLFIEQLALQKSAIIIGARNMNQASVPGGSSFGNRFSNFWFKLETGITSPDTQSGYRLYPLATVGNMRFFTRKYEFEIEVLVRAAWKGVAITAVPVTVYYAPKEERISHFRPYKDFFRISVLNTVLVLIALLYIKPRDFFRSIFIKKNFKQLLRSLLLNPEQSAQLKAASVGFGVFMGIIPIWGFQLAAAIFLAMLLKLNKPLVIIAANISIPPMIPLILFLSYKVGAFWMGDRALNFEYSSALSLQSIKNNLHQYIYGSITLAVLAGISFAFFTFVLLKIFSKKNNPAVK